ncbi:MAG: carbohydrate kinase family protein [Nocardioides sp.]
MNESPYIVVIGGANMDLHAIADVDLVPGSSNAGTSELSPGGVGRNIAEVIARLGTPVHLVSVVGDDPLGSELVHHTEDAGVDVSHVRERPVQTGTYAAIVAANGDLVVAVADMAATDLISPLMVEAAAGLIRGARLLILDGNLLPSTIEQALTIAADSDVRVILEPVSVPKSERLRPILRAGIHLITPNRAELTALTGLPATTDYEVAVAIDALLETGVESVWVRLDPEQGSFVVSPYGSRLVPGPRIEEYVDLTGAGDAMLGAFAHALVRGDDRLEAVHYAHAAAALTIASRQTVRTDLSDELIRAAL